ncbi:hypothetical protein [Pseudaeromonas paramecii]|uniref:Glycosyltransferase RgtA/B/C/D-like domain-containing protein n=1 Tax=Pseudaeromonas paramecii TaxID=2138166 RepID=A0ABP8Q4R7_9GAMM
MEQSQMGGRVRRLLSLADEQAWLRGWLCLLLAGLLTVQNPLWYGMAPAFDASLFAVMGKMWSEGAVLYRDMLDIKGPMIFALDALGYRLGGFAGMAAFETLLLTLGLFSAYGGLRRLGCSVSACWLALLATLALCGLRYYYGNMTEEWSLALALLAFGGFASQLQTGRFVLAQAWLPALTMGLVFMMRPNNAVLWAAWYAGLACLWLAQGQWRQVVWLALSALAGLLLVALPLLAYFWRQGVWDNFVFYAYGVFFGHSYGSGFSLAVGLVGLLRTGWLLLLPWVLWGLFSQGLGEQLRLRSGLLWVLLWGGLAGLVANSVSGHVYDHYDELILPLLPLSLALLLHWAGQGWRWAWPVLLGWGLFLLIPHTLFDWTRFEWPLDKVALQMGVALGAGGLLILAGWRFLPQRGLSAQALTLGMSAVLLVSLTAYSLYLAGTAGRPFNAQTWQQVQQIRAESSPDDTLWVEGTLPQFYVWSDRAAATPYLFFDNVSPGYDVKAAVLAALQAKPPRFILVRGKKLARFRADPAAYSVSQRALLTHIVTAYDEVQPGLFRRRG